MAKPSKTLERVLEGQGTISFRDFERLLAFGFKHDRTSGSHRIYLHPRATRPLSVPPRGKDAKPYQIRQVRDMIEEFGLKLKSCAIMHYAIIVFWSDEDGAWVANVPDLRSCAAFGETPEEAVAEVRVAMDAWLAAREAGHPIPEARNRPHRVAAE